MTQGSVGRHMVRFAIPLLLGNVLQQLYNTADSIIVGRIAGKVSLAAVGSAGSIMNVLMFLIVGISIGASVLVAEFFGKRDPDMLKRELATTLVSGMIFTVALAVAAFVLIDPLLRLIRTPTEIQHISRSYLVIIIPGLGFTFLYNILSGALRALGNANAPLGILALAAASNVVMDLALVPSMGAAGAALATVAAQAMSVLACMVYIRFKVPALRLGLRDLRIDLSLLKKTVSYSSVSAIQQAVVYIGVMAVQGAVNPLGVDSIAAYNAVSKMDGFALMPGTALASALSTFVAQNRGAGRHERIPSGLYASFTIGLCYCAVLTVLLLTGARRLMLLFLDPSETAPIAVGVDYLKRIAFPYLLTPICQNFQGFFRGLGRMVVTLTATVIQIPVRAILAHLLVGSMALNAVPLAVAIGWVCQIVYELAVYRNYRVKMRVQAEQVTVAS